MESSIQIEQPKHGGARQGSGRKPLDVNAVALAARSGKTPMSAALILATIADERALWKRVLGSEDDRILLDALKFLVSMRDGKPAQQINVSSIGVTITATEAAKAREIVRELMSTSPIEKPVLQADGLSIQEDSAECNIVTKPLMLAEGGGGNEGG